MLPLHLNFTSVGKLSVFLFYSIIAKNVTLGFYVTFVKTNKITDRQCNNLFCHLWRFPHKFFSRLPFAFQQFVQNVQDKNRAEQASAVLHNIIK